MKQKTLASSSLIPYASYIILRPYIPKYHRNFTTKPNKTEMSRIEAHANLGTKSRYILQVTKTSLSTLLIVDIIMCKSIFSN